MNKIIETYKNIREKFKIIWTVIRGKESSIFISLPAEDLAKLIERVNLKTDIRIRTINMKEYPFFFLLKSIADIIEFDEMVLMKAEYQAKMDEQLNGNKL